MSGKLERDDLRRLLDRWESGELTPGEVVEKAEAIEAEIEHWEGADLDRLDPRQMEYLVLVHLADGHMRGTHHDDIPVFRRLLVTPVGEEERALAEFDAYHKTIDWKRRGRLLCEGYYWKDVHCEQAGSLRSLVVLVPMVLRHRVYLPIRRSLARVRRLYREH